MNQWIFRLIALIIAVASPELRKGIEDWLNTLEKQAQATDNPWDDILVAMLRTILLGKDTITI